MSNGIGESIARNTTVMIVAQVITWTSSFVLLLFLPRYLGSEAYGRLYLAVSLGMIIGMIIDFGGNYLIPKEVARAREKTSDILVSYAVVRTLLWVTCMAGLLLFSYLVGYSGTVTLLIVILGISKLWEGFSKAVRGCFQGYEQMEYPSVGVIAEKIFVSLIAVTALLLGAGAVEVAVIMMAGALLNFLVCLKFVPLIVRRLPKFNLSISSNLLKNSLPYFLWSLFAIVYYRIDAVMLSTMTTEAVVGWYGGAYRFFDILMFLPVIFTTVVFPIFSRLWESDGKHLARTFQQSLKIIIMVGVPVCVLLFFYADNLVSLFYGLEEYGPSVIILQIFSAGVVLVYLDFIFGNAILATDKQRSWATVGFIAILLNIGLNWLMIPYTQGQYGNGGIGAAFATLITELFIMLSALVLLPKSYFHRFDLLIPLKCLTGGAIMGGWIGVMNWLGVFWIVQAVTGMVVYALLMISLNLITSGEYAFIKDFFTWKKMKSVISIKKQEL